MRGNSLLPPQREASAHPGMTNLIVIPVLHADALDEFPKHRQELLDLGKGYWKPASNGTAGNQDQGTQAAGSHLLQPGPVNFLLHPREWYLRRDLGQWLRELVPCLDCLVSVCS